MEKTGSVLALLAYNLKMEAPGSFETPLHVRIKSKQRHYHKKVTSAIKISCHKFTRDVTALSKRSSRLACFGKTMNLFVVSPLRKGNYRDLTKMYKILVTKFLKRKDSLEDLGVDWKIIFKVI